jgi:drug/metabolite transporter (DMT)-like permease
MALGAVLLGEVISLPMLFGAGLIVAGTGFVVRN